MITLPTQKIKADKLDPTFLIIFSKPKCGKSTACAALENNLCIDLEVRPGYEHLDAVKIRARSVSELAEIANTIEKANKDAGKFIYDHITIDTATELEDIVKPLALQLYAQTPMGKSYTGDILKLPNGSGYMYLREAFIKIIDRFQEITPCLILIAHTKDTLINKEGKEASEFSLDLSGKLARLISARATDIGFLRREKNQTILNFKAGDDFIVGARSPHLQEKEIVLSERNEDGTITTHWDRIFKNKKSA